MQTHLKADRLKRFSVIDIYPVISSEFTNGRPCLEILKQIAAGGAHIVQLREKSKSKKELYELALAYRRICSAHSMLLIVNDHLDVAMAAGADGVHLGQNDLPVAAVRAVAPELIIGASAHNVAEALRAQSDGADYVNLGPIYPTNTKSVPTGPVGIELIKEAAPQLNIPFTVMGGIKERHLPELFAAGARKIAMVTEITQATDPAATMKKLRTHFLNANFPVEDNL